MIRLVDLPGVDAIERRLLLTHSSAAKTFDHELEALVAKVSGEVFGLTPEREPFGEGFDEHARDHTPTMEKAWDTDEEGIAMWRGVGWDIAIRPGEIARSYAVLARSIVRVTLEIDGETEGRSLAELEAEAWMGKRGVEPGPKPEPDLERNRRFLDLGSRPRRGRGG